MPRGRVKGQKFRMHAPMNAERGRYKLWRSMRVLTRSQGGFTRVELEVVTGASRRNIQDYLRGLMTAGYVRKVSSRGSAHIAFYALERDTGPHAPHVRADWSVFDPNLAAEKDEEK